LELFYRTKIQELLGFNYNFDLNDNNMDNSFEVDFLKLQFQISYDLKELQLETIEKGLMTELEKSFLLQQIDNAWKENLRKMSFFRDSIRWRAYGQKNPLTDYKQESYNFFITMLTRIRHRVIYFILKYTKLIINTVKIEYKKNILLSLYHNFKSFPFKHPVIFLISK
jgi:preprotein translocase subunit SecA